MTIQKSKTHRRWVWDWRLLVFTGILLPVLLGLGRWQLDRASEKQALLDRWQQQSQTLSWAEHLQQGLQIDQPVALVGQYSQRYHWLLDNRTREGVPGYEVLSVFYPEQGPPVVVNRGWLPGKQRRSELPEFSTPTGLVSLQGRIGAFPEPPVLAERAEQHQWPKRVQSLSTAQARAEEEDLADGLVRLSGREQPGAFVADWAPDVMGPQTHYGYAVQWFSLAMALIILTLVASFRKMT
ncbi:SURF1 family protein [Marinobacter caseinilyticus]|uniref:SURF1 family protein n=1 Tax=Marinobacter caseinilyticus TaxID=2692195 RepID=UPI00140C6866|nr:SURF1 family protein [Marinobacter caseinilyticus]